MRSEAEKRETNILILGAVVFAVILGLILYLIFGGGTSSPGSKCSHGSDCSSGLVCKGICLIADGGSCGDYVNSCLNGSSCVSGLCVKDKPPTLTGIQKYVKHIPVDDSLPLIHRSVSPNFYKLYHSYILGGPSTLIVSGILTSTSLGPAGKVYYTLSGEKSYHVHDLATSTKTVINLTYIPDQIEVDRNGNVYIMKDGTVYKNGTLFKSLVKFMTSTPEGDIKFDDVKYTYESGGSRHYVKDGVVRYEDGRSYVIKDGSHPIVIGGVLKNTHRPHRASAGGYLFLEL
jgi:hypothetical protein